MDQEIPSRQEMFNRAWNGLKSQGWEPAFAAGSCEYITQDGKRCAWGWVDPEGTVSPLGYGRIGSVNSLRMEAGGLARRLSESDAAFAMELQDAHDRVPLASERGASGRFTSLEESMRDFAGRHQLTIPEG